MKKIAISSVTAVCLAFGANAQDYKDFKMGLGFGSATPAAGGSGVLFYLEPAFRINDDLAVGIRWESAAMAKSVGTLSAKVSTSSSYTLNGQYYFGASKFRPFAGLGFGLFSNATVKIEASSSSTGVATDLDPGSSFGVYPRVGFDFGHFNFIIDYNIVPDSKGFTVGTVSGKIKNSYLSVKIGISIGGGSTK